MPNNPRYAFDPYANLAANYVKGERHTITVKNGYDFHYIIPDYAPFYVKDFKLYTKTQQGAKKYLVEGVDFVFGFRFIQAFQQSGEIVYGSISFINRQYAGDVYIDYRTVGGDWTISKEKIAQIIAEWQNNPLTSSWEQVANIPYQFPPITHTHPVNDLTTVAELIDEIRKLSGLNQQVLEQVVDSKLTQALSRITKETLGLGNVRNLNILPINQGGNRTDSFYVTPRGVSDIITNMVMPVLNGHINAVGNVHNLTAADIGAITRTEVESLLSGKLGRTEKAADSGKLDNRTSDQLRTWVLSGTSANTVMFNNLTYPKMIEDVTNRLQNMIDTSISAGNAILEQRLSTLTAGNATKFNNLTASEYADWLLAKNIDAATLNKKTSAQIVTEAKTNVNATRLEGSSKSEIINEAKTNVNATTLSNKTYQQLIAEIRAQVSGNALTFDGMNKDQYRTWLFSNSTGINAATVGGKTVAQIITEATVNSGTLGGMTAEQIIVAAYNRANNSINARTVENYTVAQIINSARAGKVSDSTLFNGKTESVIVKQIQDAVEDDILLYTVQGGAGENQLRIIADPNGSGFKNSIQIGWDANNALRVSQDGKDAGEFIRYIRPLVSKDSIDSIKDIGHYRVDAAVGTMAKGFPVAGGGLLSIYPSHQPGGIVRIYRAATDSSIYQGFFNPTTNVWTTWRNTSFDPDTDLVQVVYSSVTNKAPSVKAVNDLRLKTESDISDLYKTIDNLKLDYIHSGTGPGQIKPNFVAGVPVNTVTMGWNNNGQLLISKDKVAQGSVFIHQVNLNANINLNDLFGQGNYGVYANETNAAATPANNYPVQLAGTLTVWPTAYNGAQTYQTFQTGEIWFRGRNGAAAWLPWERINIKPSELLSTTSGVDATRAASSKAVGDLNATLTNQINGKLNNTGAPSISGLLEINNTNWGKIRIPTNEGGNYIVEFNPNASHDTEGTVRANITYTKTGQPARYLQFPDFSTGNKTVAYQDWVNNAMVQNTADTITKIQNDGLAMNKAIGGIRSNVAAFCDKSDVTTGLVFPAANTLGLNVSGTRIIESTGSGTNSKTYIRHGSFITTFETSGDIITRTGNSIQFSSLSATNNALDAVKTDFLNNNKIKAAYMPMTVSQSAPPATTTGYNEGHIWIQF